MHRVIVKNTSFNFSTLGDHKLSISQIYAGIIANQHRNQSIVNDVGFWFPRYWSGIAVPEFHLHFIAQDHSTGGHVLDVNLIRGQVSIAPINEVQVYLPNTKSFAEANLSAEKLTSSIKQAEGGS